MLSDSGERKPARAQQSMGYPPPQQTDPMPCPRCDSINTKFCYYNNYNLSQPRHFCKSCRRYWTQGGTLRDVPVGGGSRKNSKRSRSCNSSATSASTATSSSSSMNIDPVLTEPISVLPNSVKQDSVPSEDVNLNENGGLTSLLNSQGPGFLALGGYGLGIGSGFDDQFGFGYGRGVFQFPEVGDFTNGGNGLGASSGCNTWQINGSEGGLADGDCFAWPDLTISMSGKGVK